MGNSVAGILDCKHCFCGTPDNLAGIAGKVLSVPKVECTGVPCEGDGKEKECGGGGDNARLPTQLEAEATA